MGNYWAWSDRTKSCGHCQNVWLPCDLLFYNRENNQPGYERVEFDELLAKSDIVSVHAPLTEQTEGLMNAEAFSKMKPSAIF